MDFPEPDIIEVNPEAFQKAENSDAQFVSERKYDVRLPESELNEFIIEVRSSEITRVRKAISNIKLNLTIFQELLLLITSLSFGAWFSYLLTTNQFSGFMFFLFDKGLLILGVASGISYFFLRHKQKENSQTNIDFVLDNLPNPQKTIEKEKK